MRFLIPLIGTLLLILSLPLQAGRLPTLHSAPDRHLSRNRPRPWKPPRPNTPLAAQTQTDVVAQGLLKRMLQAENSLALTGNQVTTITRNGLDLSSEQQVQRNGARALRIDYIRPTRLAGEQIIDNGRFYCHLIPSKDTLELSPSRIQSLRVRVPEIIGQIRSGRLIVQGLGQNMIAGHACGIVQVAARNSGPVAWRRFWIDPVNGAQLRIEQYDAGGQIQSVSYYTQITYSPHFDGKTFRLPSNGSKVVMSGFATPSLTLDQVRAQAGFAVLAPTYLPESFRYQAGSVSDAHGHRVVEIRYFNGANALSIFETPNDSDSAAARTEHPRPGVLFGRQAGMKVVIIGNVGSHELEKVLMSLK